MPLGIDEDDIPRPDLNFRLATIDTFKWKKGTRKISNLRLPIFVTN